MPYFLLRAKVEGCVEYATYADSPEQAIEKCKKMEDTYEVTVTPEIDSEEIVDCEEIDIDNLDEYDKMIQRAAKFVQNDVEGEEEPEPPKKKRGRPKKKKD